MADVFVSYRREDHPRISGLVRAIQRAGYSVWFDEQIDPGEDWFARILGELEKSRVTLGIWSRASLDEKGLFRPNGDRKYYMKIEHDRTASGRLIPVQLDSRVFALEYQYLQAVDLSSWAGQRDDRNFQALLSRLVMLLGQPKKSHRPWAHLNDRIKPFHIAGTAAKVRVEDDTSIFEVRLDGGYLAWAWEEVGVKVSVGDRVLVEMSPFDGSKGCIIERLGNDGSTR